VDHEGDHDHDDLVFLRDLHDVAVVRGVVQSAVGEEDVVGVVDEDGHYQKRDGHHRKRHLPLLFSPVEENWSESESGKSCSKAS